MMGVTLGMKAYRLLEVFNNEKYKGLRFIPYRYMERFKMWVLTKFVGGRDA